MAADSVFVDVKNNEIISGEPDQNFQSIASMQVGQGSTVARSDQSGSWWGAEKFAAAPASISMLGVATFTSITITGYVEDVGGTYDSAASGARVRILPDANTGIQIIDNAAGNVFLAEVGGTNVGDVTIGDYAGGNGMKWDKSASSLLIKGDMSAGTIDGVTITGGTVTGSTISTASSGERVTLTSSSAEIKLYDSGNDEVFQLDDNGTDVTFESKDSRGIKFTSASGEVEFADRIKITDSGGIEFTGERSSALSYDWGIAPYVSGGVYGWVSNMQGGDWNFSMNAGVPT